MQEPPLATVDTPFLTEVDPEIAVKGSMDPLGLLPLWTRYGRRVVGNLTLVASSARGFTTLLLGYAFARRLVEERGLPEVRFVDAFLVFEQIAAYSRLADAEEREVPVGRVLGLRRVRGRYASAKRVPIGGGRDAQILSNQRAYGLWALFSGAAEQSGLLERKAMRLSEVAEAFVCKTAYRRLEEAGLRDGRAIVDLMAKPSVFEPRGRHEPVARTLAALHEDAFDADEQAFYLEHLARGGLSDPDGCQRALWEVLHDFNEAEGRWGDALDMGELEGLIALARKREYTELAERLESIRRFDHVIGPASLVFGYLQEHGDERAIEDVASAVRGTWGEGLRHVEPERLVGELEPVRQLHGDIGVQRFERLARALREGEWAVVIECVLAQNADVMARRGGGPWVVADGDVLRVRYRQDRAELIEAPERELLHPYFLRSVKAVGGQVLGKLRDTEEDGDA